MWRKLKVRKDKAAGRVELGSLEATEDPPASNLAESSDVSRVTTASSGASKSALSSFPSPSIVVTNHTRQRSADRRADPLGLNVIFEPETSPSLDIIFVHGLGGTSRQTWSKNRDPELFWPHKWLPLEPDIQSARVLSFGYNAHFLSSGPGSISRISDFAKDLLYGMRFSQGENSENLGIGERPIIFVVHSMGGLVVKKAYILGQNNEDYKDIVSSIKAILFLATPHRGTNLAEILNRILSVSVFNHSPKEYISELVKNSPALEELNEQFRNNTTKLQIFSFYETLQTAIGPKKVMILEKDSSILGYPGEISKSMNADHHNVCKYDSPQDSNYIGVRNALKSLVSRFRSVGRRLLAAQSTLDLEKITLLLGVSEIPSEDLSFFTERWKPGTCEWISYNPAFAEWFRDSTDSGILWMHALPASGKSILASYIVTLLLDLFKPCGYFFFRFDDHSKKSLAACLRSLAFQTAQQLPDFQRALNSLSDTGLKLEKADARTIWKKVFQGILFKSPLSTGLYWVIDGLDESDSPKLLIDLLSSLTSSQLPIKVLLVSRRSPELALAMERSAMTTPLRVMPIGDNQADIEVFVKQEIELVHATPELKVDIVRRLLDKAYGNFLWVKLALDELLECYTQDDIEEALEGIPAGMEELYLRMESSITKSSRASHKALATSIFSWAVCGRRPLTIEELSQALLPEFPMVRDLKDTVSQMCGQFVVVDANSAQVKMVHQTARDFLLNASNSSLSIQPLAAHEQLFSKCVNFLNDPQIRRRPGQVDERAFARYAAVSWAYHLDASSPASENVLNLLADFFKGQAVLVWISVLASIGDLKTLVQTSRSLAIFIQRRRKYDAGISPLLHRLREIEALELWATDLNKICAKFSQNLLGDPSTIYKLVPPFCARDSMIYKQFASKDLTASALRVSGISDTGWDDNLAKINVNPGHRATSIVCFGSNFAVLTSNGNIVLYNAITFEKMCTFEHGEKVLAMSWSNSGAKFVSYGFRTTKIWLMSTLQLEFTVACPTKSRALGITFSSDDSRIIIGCNDRSVRILALDNVQAGWSLIDARLLREEGAERGHSSSPSILRFNPDATYVAVAYRDFPLSAWSIESSEMIGRCVRSTETHQWSPVSDMIWHPTSGEVLGRYHDGAVFKWHPYDQTHQEVFADATTVACSPEGSLFAITDAEGRIKLYNFHHFTIIYQLSYQGFSNQITFSPDSRRIYDLRGQFCNAWEPNALIRLNETEERESEIGSELGSTPAASMISEAHSEARDLITALTVCPGTRFYAAANDAGLVQIFEHGKFVSELWKSKNMLTAVHVDWAEDGKHVAIFELGGKVFIQQVERPSKPNTAWSSKEQLAVKIGVEVGGVQQTLLNHTATHFLVASRTSTNVWSCHAGEIVTSRTFVAKESPLRWMNHPTDSKLLLAFSLNHITVFKWHDMTIAATLDFTVSPLVNILYPNDQDQDELKHEVPSSSVNSTKTRINRLILSPTKSHVIVQYSQSLLTTRIFHQTLIFDTKSLSDATHTKLVPIPIPAEVSAQVEIPLTVLSKSQYIFLDKQHWMCSFRIDGNESPKRHFFLPRDWLNTDSLALCTMLNDGTFLCPKNGEVAAVKSAVGAEW